MNTSSKMIALLGAVSLSGCSLLVKDPPVLFRATHCTAPNVCSSVESARDYPLGFTFKYHPKTGLVFEPKQTSVDPALLSSLEILREQLNRVQLNVPGIGVLGAPQQ